MRFYVLGDALRQIVCSHAFIRNVYNLAQHKIRFGRQFRIKRTGHDGRKGACVYRMCVHDGLHVGSGKQHQPVHFRFDAEFYIRRQIRSVEFNQRDYFRR